MSNLFLLLHMHITLLQDMIVKHGYIFHGRKANYIVLAPWANHDQRQC